MNKIVTWRAYPPIPNCRDHDWCAYWADDVEEPWRYGWGATREEALIDLARLDQERAEADGGEWGNAEAGWGDSHE